MIISMALKLPHHPFWNFSLQIYRQKPAKDALLALQNQYHLNVNVLLYCCWFATLNQGQLNQAELKQLLTLIQPWHEQIITPLRLMRNRLKESPKAWAQEIREEVLAIELDAEHIEQLMLADATEKKPKSQKRTPQQRASLACHNIACYCTLAGIAMDQVGCGQAAQLINIVFPELNTIEATNICKTVLLNKQLPKQAPKINQLQLKLRT